MVKGSCLTSGSGLTSGSRLRFRGPLTRASGFAGRALAFHLAVRARVAVRAVALHLAMRAGVAGHALRFTLPCGQGLQAQLQLRAVAVRAVQLAICGHAGRGCSAAPRMRASTAFQLTMRAGVSVRAGLAGRAVVLHLAMRAGLQSAQKYFAFPCGHRFLPIPCRRPPRRLLRGAPRRVRSSHAKRDVVVFSIDEVTCVLSLPTSQKKEEETSAPRQKVVSVDSRRVSFFQCLARAPSSSPRRRRVCRDGRLEGPRGRLERGDLPPPEAHAEGVAARHAGHGASRRHPPGSPSAPPRPSARETASRTAKQRDADVDARNRARISPAPVSCLQDTPGRWHHPPSTPLTSSRVRSRRARVRHAFIRPALLCRCVTR